MTQIDPASGRLLLDGELTPGRLRQVLGLSEAEAETRKNDWDDLLFASLDKEREAKKQAGWAGLSPDPDRLALCRQLSQDIAAQAQAFYGDEDFNFYSNAYLPENLYVFATTLAGQPKDQPVRYLEVGVNKGLSSLAVARLGEALGIEVTITGVDPYFAEGYVEGALRKIDKVTRDRTLAFLQQAGAKFELIEATSRGAFQALLREGRTFDLIYIDGRHEHLFPLVDVGSYINLLPPDGALLIDDYFWKDVFQIKHLFDKHAAKVCESWKIAAYRFPAGHDRF
jgi:predicted O-methyltransferase YrrM